MAATLALLRSRLLLPPDGPEARAAQDEAEAMRRLLLERAALRHAAEWLDRQPQLGRDVFARGGVADAAARSGRTTDITDLFRACLVALRAGAGRHVRARRDGGRPHAETSWSESPKAVDPLGGAEPVERGRRPTGGFHSARLRADQA